MDSKVVPTYQVLDEIQRVADKCGLGECTAPSKTTARLVERTRNYNMPLFPAYKDADDFPATEEWPKQYTVLDSNPSDSSMANETEIIFCNERDPSDFGTVIMFSTPRLLKRLSNARIWMMVIEHKNRN